jgi:rhamnose transport system permease protein
MIPQWNGDRYFVNCREGAEEAARELDSELEWNGPNAPDSTAQLQILQTAVIRRPDVIAVAPADPYGLSATLRRARARGIRVVTWDSDAQADDRDIFVAPAGVEETGRLVADEAAHQIGGSGDVAVLAARWPEWLEAFQARVSERHPGVKVAAVRSGCEYGEQALRQTRDLLRTIPSIKLVLAQFPFSIDATAEAVLLSGRKVNVIGIGASVSCRRHRDTYVTPATVDWDARDLGYLTVYAAVFLARHQAGAGADSISAGRLGTRDLCRGRIVLGPPRITRSSQ